MEPDSLAALEPFRATALAGRFRADPLGFVDVGALGGVHPVVDPIAGLVHALCIEPDPAGFDALKAKYASPKPYAAVSLERAALAEDARTGRELHICAAPTNTSLLEPNPAFIERYNAVQFRLSRVERIDTTTLDEIVFSGGHPARSGEFLKIDTQGSEYQILQGATRVLRERCVAIHCEVEFFEVYRRQATLIDVASLLREHGFALYGLYPHYRSCGSLDRRRYDTEERLMWADAVFFKDPLDDAERAREFPARWRDALILCALALRFYDFALELAGRYLTDPRERELLGEAVRAVAQGDRDRLWSDFRHLQQAGAEPDFVRLAQFLDRQRYNGSTEHLWNNSSSAAKTS